MNKKPRKLNLYPNKMDEATEIIFSMNQNQILMQEIVEAQDKNIEALEEELHGTKILLSALIQLLVYKNTFADSELGDAFMELKEAVNKKKTLLQEEAKRKESEIDKKKFLLEILTTAPHAIS